jgi:gliding motility-associated-like protein
VISNASNQSAGIYTVVGTATNGCTKSATVAVSLYPSPVIVASGSSVCINQTVHLSVTGGVSYTWTGPGGFTANQQTVNIVNAWPQLAGSYTVQATDNNGCTGQGLAVVVVHNLPDITASSDPAVCAGGNLSLHAQSTVGDGFQWSGPGGFNSVLKDPKLLNVNANNAGTYTVIVSDDIGCTNSAVLNIVVHNLPQASILTDKISGCAPLCIDFGTKSNTSLQSCEWNFGDNTGMSGLNAGKCFTNAGTYSISAKYTDDNGCINSSSLSVQVWPVPEADFTYAPGKPTVGEPVIFTDASLGGAVITNYIWSFSNLANNTFTTEKTSCTYENAGQYAAALIVISNHGCRDTIVKAIAIEEDFEIYIPNAFSPNGDGNNDTFSPKGYGIVKYEINIFDRWGEELFSSHDFSVQWDGRYKGVPVVKEDAYVWKIFVTGTDGKTREMCGTVTVLK